LLFVQGIYNGINVVINKERITKVPVKKTMEKRENKEKLPCCPIK